MNVLSLPYYSVLKAKKKGKILVPQGNTFISSKQVLASVSIHYVTVQPYINI